MGGENTVGVWVFHLAVYKEAQPLASSKSLCNTKPDAVILLPLIWLLSLLQTVINKLHLFQEPSELHQGCVGFHPTQTFKEVFFQYEAKVSEHSLHSAPLP